MTTPDLASKLVPAVLGSVGALGKENARLQRVLATAAVAQQAWTVTSAVRTWRRDRAARYEAENVYKVTVGVNDGIWGPFSAWLNRHVERDTRALLFATGFHNDQRRVVPDVAEQVTFELDGHSVRLDVEAPGDQQSDRNRRATMTVSSRAGQERLLALLEELSDLSNHATGELFTFNGYGFSPMGRSAQRPWDSVALRAGQAERIRDDVAAFLEQSQEYGRRGIPWHRGILLHGEPGTGKTSFVKALATELDLNLYYVPIGAISSDARLTELVSEVGPRSLLLLEDIDSLGAANSRDAGKGTVPDDEGTLTMSGLLNVLDGVATPEGLITVMTTNVLSALDPAVLRPGRVDLVEEVLPPDDEQLGRLFSGFYGEPPASPISVGDRSSAAIVEVFKRHMFDPVAAAAELAGA